MDETNLNQFREVTPSGTFTLQNSSLLKVRLDGNAVQAKPSEGPTVPPHTHVRQG